MVIEYARQCTCSGRNMRNWNVSVCFSLPANIRHLMTLTVLNGNWRLTCSHSHVIHLYCRPSLNVLSRLLSNFYLMLFFLFLIVRRPRPNFVCKGRHTSSVLLLIWILDVNIDGIVWYSRVLRPHRHIIGHFGDDFTGHMKDWPNQQCHSTEG